jgi:hypothetical protein
LALLGAFLVERGEIAFDSDLEVFHIVIFEGGFVGESVIGGVGSGSVVTVGDIFELINES